MTNVIEARQVSFGYAAQPVLERISFSIKQGDFAALIGSNGAGKSTLLKLLLGELTPIAGTLSLLGEDVTRFHHWPLIGYVPQNAAAIQFPATAEEIVRANLFSQVGLFRPFRKEHRQKAREALALVGMEPYAGRLISQLSGGQQQRVQIARILVGNPRILILDEPVTGMDSTSAEELYQLLQQLNKEQGLTILMVTHDLNRSARYITKALCLEEGSLVELSPQELQDELRHKHTHPRNSKGEQNGNLSV